MSPDKPAPNAGFALLSSGANFSCEVLQALIRRRYLPEMLVLPEYSPAHDDVKTGNGLIIDLSERRLLALARDIEIVYAPAARQAEFAQQVERRSVDFLLVACWPYLIDTLLIESAARATLNLHPSLLPKYRGPNPLTQQLDAGDFNFGVSLHLLNQHFDQGDIIAQSEVGVPGTRSGRSMLEQRCAQQGVDLFIEAVDTYPDWSPVTQSS